MAEQKPKLQWRADCGEWFANAGPLDLNIQQERDFYWWYVESRDESRNGSDVPPIMSLLTAQLAAEAAALAWLSQGVAAFGARVLTRERAALCTLALDDTGHRQQGSEFRDECDRGDAMRRLARELEGGEHG